MKIDCMDYFAGFGGFTSGAQAAGSNVVVHVAVNHNPNAIKVHAHNHPETMHFIEDLMKMPHSVFRGEIRVLLAAPACQGHSKAARPARSAFKRCSEYHDRLRATAWAVIDGARDIEPDAVIVENVPQFEQWAGFPAWRADLESLGYRVQIHHLRASDFGVAQLRDRVFISAVRGNAPVHVTPTTPGARLPASSCIDWNAGSWKPIGVSKGRALAKRKAAFAKFPHGSVCSLFSHNSYYNAWTEPFRTITTKYPSQTAIIRRDGQFRRLRPSEIARAMGFGTSHQVPKGLTLEQLARGYGGAVCPPVGSAIFKAVIAATPGLTLAAPQQARAEQTTFAFAA